MSTMNCLAEPCAQAEMTNSLIAVNAKKKRWIEIAHHFKGITALCVLQIKMFHDERSAELLVQTNNKVCCQLLVSSAKSEVADENVQKMEMRIILENCRCRIACWHPDEA